jgi:DedD protein
MSAMENRIKERLTGAAILVALIVMLVPEMFRGQGDHGSAPAGGSNGPAGSSDGAPMRSYTIDLSNNAKGGTPLQSMVDSTEPSTPAATAVASAPQAAGNATVANTGDVPAAVPTATPAASKQLASAPPQPSQPSEPTRHAAPATTRAAAGSWSVQLGLFSKRENAERMVAEAKAKGFNVSISGADAKGLFHVRTASSSDRTSAQNLAQRLKGEGFAATVVGP